MKRTQVITFFFLCFFLFSTVLAEDLFTFSTEPQSVDLNTLSNPITIHSNTPVSETTYITLTSTSGTGQFFSNKTSAEPITSGSYVYISTNNSNRTVYYKDSTAGDFVITANIFNKEKTSQIATITQHIIIGSQVPGTGSSGNATTTNTSSDTQTTESQSYSNTSAHSSPASLSNIEQKTELEISAGRDRLTTIGNNLIFRAVPTKIQNIPEMGITYLWSFGDGTTALGNNINHAYKFAGDYSVVVNANYSDKQAVSRMQVKVISPDILMTRVIGGTEIFNKSKTEINLEGWRLISQKKSFIFPSDTLIPSGRKIIFADEITGMSDQKIQLLNPLGKEFAFIEEIKVKEVDLKIDLKDIQTKIEQIKNTIAQIYPETRNDTPTVKTVKQTNPQIITNLSTDLSKNLIQTANVIQVFEGQKEIGLINRIFAWPIKGFDFVRHLFIEE